jgi:hypothetical protein
MTEPNQTDNADYKRGFSDGYCQTQFNKLSIKSIPYNIGYKQGLHCRFSDKIEIAVDRMIEAQKKGRVILDFDKDLNYYLKNEF